MLYLDISVVTFNSEKWLEKFFLSLLAQTIGAAKLGIFICDNGSNDNTVSFCDLLKEKYQSQFHKIVITRTINNGFGAGHNLNLKQSSADYFLVSNVDLEFEANAFQELMSAVAKSEASVASWELRQKPFEHPKYYNPVTLETRWSSSACVLFRKKALLAVGGYEERIFMYGEDVELSYRLRDHGHVLQYCPKAVCWHYAYEYAGEVKPLQFYGSKLANVYIRLRYGSIKQIITGYLQYLGLFCIRRNLKKYYRNLLKNFWVLLKNTPYFLKTRKKTKKFFPIKGWDYDLRREGAFYEYSKQSPNRLPLVSVIIRTYKGRLELLKEAVQSLQNQTYSNIELIIVEDGSQEADAYIKDLQERHIFSQIKYLPIEKVGRCVAGNIGLENASGELVNFLDDDDLFFADHLEVLVSALNANVEAGAAYAVAFEVGTEIIRNEPLKYIEFFYRIPPIQPFSRVELWERNYMPIQSVLFHRELFLKYGGFATDLENLEDWNLWTRYSLEKDFVCVNKLTSLYRVPSNTKQYTSRQLKLTEYYIKAREKQKELQITANVAELANDVSEIKFKIESKLLNRRLKNCIKHQLIKFPKLYVAVKRVVNYFNKIHIKNYD